jgi:hypothetical protein
VHGALGARQSRIAFERARFGFTDDEPEQGTPNAPQWRCAVALHTEEPSMLRVEHIRDYKVTMLQKALGIDRPCAIGIVSLLVLFVADHGEEDGALQGKLARHIAAGVEWAGDPEELITALIDAEYLDRDGNTLRFVNWADFMPPWVQDRLRKRAERARSKASADTASGTVPDIPGKSLSPPLPSSLTHTTPRKPEGASAPSAATRSDDAGASTRSVSARGRSKRTKSSDAMRWDRDAGWSGIVDEDRARWAKAYPAVDVDRQLAAMTEWLLANPAKAHKSNWRKFVTNWLTRRQDAGGDVGPERRPLPRDGPIPFPSRQRERDAHNEQERLKVLQRRGATLENGENAHEPAR